MKQVKLTATAGMLIDIESILPEVLAGRPTMVVKIAGTKPGKKANTKDYLIDVNPAGLDWLIDELKMHTDKNWEHEIAYLRSLQCAVKKMEQTKSIWKAEMGSIIAAQIGWGKS
jgi:hypothetical protein